MQLWKLSTVPKSCREVLANTFILHTIVIGAGTNYVHVPVMYSMYILM